MYIYLPNILDTEMPLVQNFLYAILACIYGIPLKWELHTNSIVWGKGCIHMNIPDGKGVGCSNLALVRKGFVLSLDEGTPDEWMAWVSASLPHGRSVRGSHFIALLHKSVWYVMSLHDIRLNLRSLMWGVGVKQYPWKCCFPPIRCFYHKYLDQVVTLKQLSPWHQEGKKWCTGH